MPRRPSPDKPLLQRSSDSDPRWLPPCPLRLPQAPRSCLGYYERGPGRLQVRFLAYDNEGRCEIVVDEGVAFVIVRLVICRGERHLGYPGLAEERDHVELAESLGERIVIDFETGEPVPVYVPTWHDNRQTKAPGFYADNAAARDAWELLPEGVERDGPRFGAFWPLRTLGF